MEEALDYTIIITRILVKHEYYGKFLRTAIVEYTYVFVPVLCFFWFIIYSGVTFSGFLRKVTFIGSFPTFECVLHIRYFFFTLITINSIRSNGIESMQIAELHGR